MSIPPPSSLLLYSTNTALKFRIQREFLGDRHYVWCSEAFDSQALGKYSRGAAMAASSNPCSIFKELKAAVISNDHHCSKIVEQRKTLQALAIQLESGGKISPEERDEIVAIVSRASIQDFTPYLYVIPCAGVANRANPVPVMERAGLEREWIISDLSRDEFHILEFPL